MKRLIILSLVGIGIYLILSKRKAYAQEIPEIQPEISPVSTITKNPAVNMVEQIVKESTQEIVSAPIAIATQPIKPAAVVVITPTESYEACVERLSKVRPIVPLHLFWSPEAFCKIMAVRQKIAV